jgi:hypothetical protein
MAIKKYRVGGYIYQFEEGSQPEGAQPVDTAVKLPKAETAEAPKVKRAVR